MKNQLQSIKKSKLSPLFLVMLFDHTSVNITFPVLTFVFFSHLSSLFPATTSLAERTLWYGVVISIAHIGGIISAPVISTISDAVGRKPMLFVATLAAFVFGLSCTFGILMGSLVFLVIGKLLGGLLSRTNPIALAIVGDVTEIKGKVVNMAYLQLVISIGAFIGPVIGGYFAMHFFFNAFNFAFPYILASLFAALAGLCVLFFFKETLKEKQSMKKSAQAWVKYLFDKRVIKISLLLCLTQITWSTFYQFMPPLLKVKFGFSPHLLGWYIGVIALWLALASAFLVKFLRKRFTLVSMVTISVGLMLVGSLMILAAIIFRHQAFAFDLLWLAAIPIAMGDVTVFSVIVTLYSNEVDPKDQGAIMGLCFIIVSAIWSVTALIGGFLGAVHITLPLYFAAFAILAVFLQRCYHHLR
jgi:MFS family permease